MKTGPSLAKALRLAKAARGGRLKDREGVAKPSPIGIFWSSLSRGVFALETANADPPVGWFGAAPPGLFPYGLLVPYVRES